MLGSRITIHMAAAYTAFEETVKLFQVSALFAFPLVHENFTALPMIQSF